MPKKDKKASGNGLPKATSDTEIQARAARIPNARKRQEIQGHKDRGRYFRNRGEAHRAGGRHDQAWLCRHQECMEYQAAIDNSMHVHGIDTSNCKDGKDVL